MTAPNSSPVASPSASGSSAARVAVASDAAAAWQDGLAAEYAAAFGYAALGPRLTVAAQLALAHACEQAHRSLAATTATQLTVAGLVPVEPQANYSLPFALTDAAAARQLALRLETSAASAWRFLISIDGPPGSIRASALAALTASAERAVRWRVLITPSMPSVPFPGI
jgi:hypothetical protein